MVSPPGGVAPVPAPASTQAHPFAQTSQIIIDSCTPHLYYSPQPLQPAKTGDGAFGSRRRETFPAFD